MRIRYLFTSVPAIAVIPLFGISPAVAEDSASMGVYDEASYTEYVEETMAKLDKLYLDFCDACGVDATKAGEAKREFLVTVRDLM
jgi:hypothetical protein